MPKEVDASKNRLSHVPWFGDHVRSSYLAHPEFIQKKGVVGSWPDTKTAKAGFGLDPFGIIILRASAIGSQPFGKTLWLRIHRKSCSHITSQLCPNNQQSFLTVHSLLSFTARAQVTEKKAKTNKCENSIPNKSITYMIYDKEWWRVGISWEKNIVRPNSHVNKNQEGKTLPLVDTVWSSWVSSMPQSSSHAPYGQTKPPKT